jgi:hypothetical protein
MSSIGLISTRQHGAIVEMNHGVIRSPPHTRRSRPASIVDVRAARRRPPLAYFSPTRHIRKSRKDRGDGIGQSISEGVALLRIGRSDRKPARSQMRQRLSRRAHPGCCRHLGCRLDLFDDRLLERWIALDYKRSAAVQHKIDATGSEVAGRTGDLRKRLFELFRSPVIDAAREVTPTGTYVAAKTFRRSKHPVALRRPRYSGRRANPLTFCSKLKLIRDNPA